MKTLPKQTVFLLPNQNCYTESKYEPHNNESVNTDLMEPVLKILCCNSTKFEQQKKRTTKSCICFSNSGPTTTKAGGRLHWTTWCRWSWCRCLCLWRITASRFLQTFSLQILSFIWILSRLNVKYALNCLDASSLKIINSISKNLTIKMFHVKNRAAHFIPKPVHELDNVGVYSHTQTWTESY